MPIIFRKIHRPIPPNSARASLVCRVPRRRHGLPSGHSFLCRRRQLPCLEFILVADQERRRGIATALVAACRKRWPNIYLTDAISEAGEGFLSSLETPKGDARVQTEPQKLSEGE